MIIHFTVKQAGNVVNALEDYIDRWDDVDDPDEKEACKIMGEVSAGLCLQLSKEEK